MDEPLHFGIVDVLAVREAVERQPPARRRVCELLLEGWSQTEIAQKMGVKRQTVNTHVRRLRASLRRMGFDGVGKGGRRRRRRSSRSPRTDAAERRATEPDDGPDGPPTGSGPEGDG